MISVCIPVGPFKSNKNWLDECMSSIHSQTMKANAVIIINDGAGKDLGQYVQANYNAASFYNIRTWDSPWRLGISHAFNFGVMLAPTECVFMLGSDDTLEPTCLEKCWESYLAHDKQDGYYSVPIKYMDTGEIQTAPCNAAMVTKGFWRKTGGFPIETAIGMGDHTLLSICIANKLPVYWVGHDVKEDDTPLYNYRRHPDIHTFTMDKWFGIQHDIEEILTRDWTPPEWGNNYG